MPSKKIPFLDGTNKLPAAQIPDLSSNYVTPGALSAAAVLLSAQTPSSAQSQQARGNINAQRITVLHALDYGLKGDTTVEDLTALNAAIAAAAPAPTAVYFPRPSGAYYNMVQALPNVSNVRYFGDGIAGTVLRWTVGSMLAPTVTLSGLVFENLAVECTGTAGHLIDLGSTGGLTFCRFRNVDLHPKNNTSSIVNMNGSGNFFGNTFEKCKLWRQPTSASPAINIIASTSGVNSCKWADSQFHSQGCPNGPFAHVECTGASTFAVGIVFENIIGEQNNGGLIHLLGASQARILNVIDYDTVGTYQDHLVRIATGAQAPAAATVDHVGTAAAATFAAGKFHLYIDGGTGHDVGSVRQAGNPGLISVPSTGRTLRHAGGFARSQRTVGGATNFGASDHLIIGNGAAVVLTLPDPTALLSTGTLPPGREFAAKNINSASLTVQSAGTAKIDGATTMTLAQWASARFVTDGTNWFTA